MIERARLIVVDPEQEFRRSLVDELRRHGHDCDAIGDAKAALAALHGDSYDAVLVNLEMIPAESLESRERGEFEFRAPLIAITDNAAVAGAVRALRLGAVDYLPKPIKPSDLTRAVGRALEKSKAILGVRTAQSAIQTWTRWFRYLDEVLLGSGPVRLPPALLSAVSEQRASLRALDWTLEGTASGGLSKREHEVLLALASGRRARQIAKEFRISIHTARHHVKAILKKLNVRSQTELLIRLRDTGRAGGRGGRG